MALPVAMANYQLQVHLLGLGGKCSPRECQRQRRARTLSPPPPRIVEQPKACSSSPSFMAAVVAKAHNLQVQLSGPRGKHSPPECQQQRQARILRSPPPPRTVEQPQACSISRSLMAAPVVMAHNLQVQVPSPRSGKRSPPKCQRQRRARTLGPPPPCTVEQSQACPIRWSFVAAFVCKGKRLAAGAGARWQALSKVTAAETSTHFGCASASHRGAAASLLDQSEVHGGSVAKADHLQVRGAWC